jgi:hypothetical protein
MHRNRYVEPTCRTDVPNRHLEPIRRTGVSNPFGANRVGPCGDIELDSGTSLLAGLRRSG